MIDPVLLALEGPWMPITLSGMVLAVFALIVAFFTYSKVVARSDGDDRMREIAASIQDGAMAFLKTEYKILGVFVAVIFALLCIAGDPKTGLCFLAGANSIFHGERLLTTPNPEVTTDESLFAKLGIQPMDIGPTDAPHWPPRAMSR